MTHLPETRHSLLVRLAEPADDESWREFQAIYERAIYRYSKARGLQDADAAEVVQQVFLAVHEQMGTWRTSGRPGAFRAWLWQTARRVSLRALRDRQRYDVAAGGTSVLEQLGQLPEAAPGETNEQNGADRDEWRQWAFCRAAAIVEREVEPITWQAFRLTAVEQQPATAVAARLGMRIGSVYTAKCRVLARLREAARELPECES